ncbi:MAG: GH92 family glycosyl hydrolase, partial [Bacteroidota bacterium]
QDISAEFTPGSSTGHFRFTFPDRGHKLVKLMLSQGGSWQAESENSISGVEEFRGMKAYMVGEFSTPGIPTQKQSTTEHSATDRNNPGLPLVLFEFPGDGKRVVEFKYGISFIDKQQARQNLEREIPGWDFESMVAGGAALWSDKLDRIRVKGGTDAQRRTFYTALYRCYERMVDINEEGRYYSAFDHQVHESDKPFYVDDWVWDTYLAQHPLRMLLDPQEEAEMLHSYVQMYEQSGWMPQFPLLYGDDPAMHGFHSSVVFLDAWRKGIRGFDVEKAYEGMRKNATEATMLPWRNGPKTELDLFYSEKGFFPALEPGEEEHVAAVHGFEKRQSVAITVAHSYDDWALAEMAGELRKTADRALFMPKAANYRNLYRSDKRLMWPKNEEGEWIDIDPKFDGGPGGRDYYDENNGYTYAWQAQHDIHGLIQLMGGREAFTANLDQLFREDLGRRKWQFWAKFPDATGLVGQYSMGNEPSFHIPYLYNYAGAPWKTQKRIRFLLDVWFKDNIFGIPGDEDGGGMSAFVVFSSMGFYPVTPGLPLYTIGSPLFEEVAIALPNGNTFTIMADGCSAVNKYIQLARLNGEILDRPWFTHEELLQGAILELEMGPTPNREWGAAPGAAPPSQLD